MDAPVRGTGRAYSPRLTAPPRDLPEALPLAIALALLAVLPFLMTGQPMLTDYGAHLARYHVMLDIGDNPWLAHYYRFGWIWTGNLGADLLMVPLGHLLGVETAGWLVGAIIPPLTGLGIVAAERALRGRVGVGSLLALTLIWSPAMVMGFYNFCLSLALALFAFAAWIRLADWRWRWALFVPVGFVVWLCHASGWGVLGVMVFGYEWSVRKSPAALLAPWPLAPPLLPMLLAGGGASAGSHPYGPVFFLYKNGVAIAAMRDQWFQLDVATPLLLLAAMAVAVAARRFDGRFGWAALLLALLFYAVPRHLGGGDYADYRLIPVALMAGCLAIDWRAPRLLLWLAPALFLVRLGVTAAAWHANGQVLQRDLTALSRLPEGARVAAAVEVDRGDWRMNPFEHAPGYATVRRDALVNAHFAIPGVHMLRLAQPLPDFVDPSQRVLVYRSQPIGLARFPPARYADYLWFIGWRAPASLPASARVLYRTPHSLLARLAKPAAPV